MLELYLGGLSPPKLTVVARLWGSEIIIGSFCTVERYEQSLFDDFAVCLDSSFYNQEDKKSNSTEQVCSSTSLPVQKTSHILQTVSLLAKWTSPLRFQRIPQLVAEMEVWARGQKFSWIGSSGHRRGRKKVRSECFRMWMSILKPENTVEDVKKQQSTENKEYYI